MRLLIILASMGAIVYAKPELYRESEDFQYSRSSSDEGSKSGFYGAQRGNMGGNYERAHNMDGLAQHQMSSAVRQVEGELGDGAKERSGSVYTAANSRGIFGSGHYDLSNLKGRNFEESGISDASLSHSSLTSQNTGYRGLAHNSAYNTGYTKSSRQHAGYASSSSADYSEDHSTDFTQSKVVDSAQQGNSQYSYGNQGSLDSDYQYLTSSGNRAQHHIGGANHQSNYDSYGRRVADTPVRVVMRPGTIVTVPVSAQTYDASSSSLRGSSYAQNSLNTEAEELSNSHGGVYVKPNTVYYTKPKHYESSYSYRKEWEKHNSQPLVPITTENPFTKNSELYDDSLLLQNAKSQYNSLDSTSAHAGTDTVLSSNANIAHLKRVNAAQQSNTFNTKSASGYQSKYNYDAAQSRNAAASAHSNAYTLGTYNSGAAANANDLVENIDTKPKSYHSSYSYHKSWERRGDPYVIKPMGEVGDNSAQMSQRLVSGSANQGAYSSHQYGSSYNQAHQSLTHSGVDCDENGHIRVGRSAYEHYYPQQQEQQEFEELGQQTQNQWDRLEDLGQQTQNKWDHIQGLGQQSQKLEDFGQQHQNLEDFGQQSQKLEDFGQQSQNLEDFSHQSQNMEAFGQQSQKLDDFGQQSQNLEEFGQQSQNLEDLGQQSQNLEDFGQQSQNLEDFGQHSENLGQQTQNQWDKFEKYNEQSQSTIHQETQLLEPFQESVFHEQSKGPISDFKQNQDSEPNLNSFWNQHQDFDAHGQSHNYDQMGGYTSKDFQIGNDQELQYQLELQKKLIGSMYNILNKQKTNEQGVEFYTPNSYSSNPVQYHHNVNYNDGQNQYTGFSHYSHEASNSGMSSSWNKQYHMQANDNSDQLTTGLHDFWSKLDNLDTPGSLNKNEKVDSDNSYHQVSDTDWSQSHWGQFNAQNQTNKIETVSKNKKNSATVSSVTGSSPTTVKPKYNSMSNVPSVNAMDVGRGDIGADETTVPNNEDQQPSMYIPKSSQRQYKTVEEIESLSLTKENGNVNNIQSGNSQQTVPIQHNDIQNKPRLVTHKDDLLLNNTSMVGKQIENPQDSKIDNIHNNKHIPVDKENVEATNHKVEPVPFDMEQKNTNQQDFFNTYNMGQQSQEPWEASEIQKNTDQQLEDFGQQLQNTFDMGPQSQMFWEPANSYEHSNLELENFGNKASNNNQQLEESSDNLESQNFLNMEQENSWEPIIPNKVADLHQPRTPLNIKSPDEEINEKQKEQPSHPKMIVSLSPEDVTEKPGFWKSVGSKFSSAKDTVVSWFKRS